MSRRSGQWTKVSGIEMQRDTLGGGARNLRIEDFVAANNHEVIMVKPNRSEAILKRPVVILGIG